MGSPGATLASVRRIVSAKSIWPRQASRAAMVAGTLTEVTAQSVTVGSDSRAIAIQAASECRPAQGTNNQSRNEGAEHIWNELRNATLRQYPFYLGNVSGIVQLDRIIIERLQFDDGDWQAEVQKPELLQAFQQLER